MEPESETLNQESARTRKSLLLRFQNWPAVQVVLCALIFDTHKAGDYRYSRSIFLIGKQRHSLFQRQKTEDALLTSLAKVEHLCGPVSAPVNAHISPGGGCHHLQAMWIGKQCTLVQPQRAPLSFNGWVLVYQLVNILSITFDHPSFINKKTEVLKQYDVSQRPEG